MVSLMSKDTNLTLEQSVKLNYNGELTIEALATLDTYTKSCCNTSATARKLHKGYMQVRKYLRQPFVREIFQLNLLKKGITPDKIAEVIREGISATNGVYHEGKKVADEVNWIARQRFVQLVAEIFEVLKYQAKVDNNNLINIQVNNIKQVIENAAKNNGKFIGTASRI